MIGYKMHHTRVSNDLYPIINYIMVWKKKILVMQQSKRRDVATKTSRRFFTFLVRKN